MWFNLFLYYIIYIYYIETHKNILLYLMIYVVCVLNIVNNNKINIIYII